MHYVLGVDNDACTVGTDELSHADNKKKWILQNVITPLKACYQLSGYPHLLRVYWILCTLPVTSCSAERALKDIRFIITLFVLKEIFAVASHGIFCTAVFQTVKYLQDKFN